MITTLWSWPLRGYAGFTGAGGILPQIRELGQWTATIIRFTAMHLLVAICVR